MSSLAVCFTAMLLVAGCASEPTAPDAVDTPAAPDAAVSDETEKEPASDAARGSAVLSMAGQSFTFALDTCMITGEDVLVSGPGVDDDSQEPAYLDIDLYEEGMFNAGEARVDLGTNEKFSSSDSFYSAQVGSGHEYSILYQDDTFVLDAIFRANGGESIGPGTFRIDCE